MAEFNVVPPGTPSWVDLASTDLSSAKAPDALAGATCSDSRDVAPGRFAVLGDPTGAVFAVTKMNPG